MARGWESKSVEQQQADVIANRDVPKVFLTPEQRDKARTMQGLALSRRHVLDQLEKTDNGPYRKMLEAALARLDAQIVESSGP